MWPLRQRQVRPTVLEASAGEPPVLTAFLELRSSVRGSGPQPHFQANFWPPPCAAPPTLGSQFGGTALQAGATRGERAAPH